MRESQIFWNEGRISYIACIVVYIKGLFFSLSSSNVHIFFQSKFNSIMYVWASPVALMVRNLPANIGSGFNPWVGKITWRRSWQSTLVFLLGESHRQRTLAGYSLCGHKKSDMIETT